MLFVSPNRWLRCNNTAWVLLLVVRLTTPQILPKIRARGTLCGCTISSWSNVVVRLMCISTVGYCRLIWYVIICVLLDWTLRRSVLAISLLARGSSNQIKWSIMQSTLTTAWQTWLALTKPRGTGFANLLMWFGAINFGSKICRACSATAEDQVRQ